MSLNTTDISNGVFISGSTSPYNTYIKTQNAGVYDIQFSAQLEKTSPGGTNITYIWLRKNGVDLAETNTAFELSQNGKGVAAWNWFVNAAANDYYQIMWSSNANDTQLTAETPTVGPTVPSLIVTANRVDQFLSNTGSFTGSFTGEFYGTASYASQSLSSSYTSTSSLATTAINARTPSTTVLSSLGSAIKAEPLWGGWQNYPGSSYALVNQRCILQPVYLYTPTTLTGVKWVQITQGAYTSSNYNGIGLYTYDGVGNLTCVASSSNNGNLWSTFANNTMGSASFSFGANYNASAGLYYIAAVWNQTGAITTNPAIGQGLSTTITTFTFDFTNSAKGTSRTTNAVTTALPTSVAMSNITALQNVFYLTLY